MTKKTTPKNNQPIEQVLFVDAETVTVDDLLKLEEANSVRDLIDALVKFTKNATDDPDAAERAIRSLSLAQLLRQRAGLIDQFQQLQTDSIPN